jgi:hypothetical protein
MLDIDLSLEAKVLLLGARTSLNNQATQELQELLAAPLNWQELIATALRHDVAQLLCHSLMSVDSTLVPQVALEQLRTYFETIALNNMFLSGELLRIISLLATHGIVSSPFKGPVLAQHVYGNVVLRRFSDLDLFIRPADLVAATEVLGQAGYRALRPIPTGKERNYIRTSHDYPLVRKDGRVVLDLQWSLLQKPFRFPPDFARWWERLEPASLAGKPILVVPPEELLLLLCVHGGKHLWERLSWVCDIAELLRRYPQLDWSYVIKLAAGLGAYRMLCLGLCLAYELLSAELPAPIRERVQQERVARSLASEVVQELFRDPGTVSSVEAQAALFFFRMRERLRDRLQLGVIFAPGLLHPIHLWHTYRPRLRRLIFPA